MADLVEATSKLVLDEETNEMVSKNELKKRLQKRAKKQARAANPKPAAAAGSGKPAAKKAEPEVVDPDAIFKQGFLASDGSRVVNEAEAGDLDHEEVETLSVTRKHVEK